MGFAQGAQTLGELVADQNHRLPPRGDLINIVFFFHAKDDRSINCKQLLFEIAGFSIERSAKVLRNCIQALFSVRESRVRELNDIGFVEAGAHWPKVYDKAIGTQGLTCEMLRLRTAGLDGP